MDLTEGSIRLKMVRFTIPIVIIQFLNQAYTIVDNVIVARFISDQALSVISTVNSALLVGYCINQGLGMVIAILIGNQFGAKDYGKLRNTVKTLWVTLTLVALLIVVVYILGADMVFGWLKVPNEIMGECKSLMWVYAISLLPTYLCSGCTAMLNGMGNSKTPMIISVSAQVLNIILDLVAVVLLDKGIVGAAVASIISVIVAMGVTFFMLEKALNQLPMEGQAGGKVDGAIVKEFVELAIPSVLQQSVMSVGNLILQVLINKEGVDYINGYVVSFTLFNLFLLVITSCCTGFETLAAQNYGAKNPKRVREGFVNLLVIGTIFGVLVSLLSWIFANPLIGLYLEDPSKVSFQFARTFLLMLIPNYFIILGKNSVDSLFKAQRKIYIFLISSFIALFVRVILGYLFVPVYGLLSLAIATMLGNVVSMLFNWVTFYVNSRRASRL